MNCFSLLSKWLWWIAMEKDALWRMFWSVSMVWLWGRGVEFERKERRVQRLSVEVYSLGVEPFCQLWLFQLVMVLMFALGWICGVGDILKDAFLDLYGISWDKGATLADHLCWRDGSMLWDVIFMWPIHDWEMDALTTFLDLIYSTKIRRNVVDKIFWQQTKSGLFELKPFYRNLYTGEGVFFPRRVFGRLKSHLR